MAKNISLMGASYTDVPAVVLPQTGGGTARFDDASVTTAVAADVAQGKVFLASDGTITTGTGTGGGGEAIIITDTTDVSGGIIREIDGMTWYTRYLPPSAELVAEHEETINLSADTDWDSWTPSTTAHTLLAAGTTRGSGSYTIGASAYQNKAVIGVAHAYTDVVFKDGTSMAKAFATGRQVICISNYAPIKLIDYSNEYYGVPQTAVNYRNLYWTSASATAVYTTSTYGIGLSGSVTLSVSSNTGTSRTVGYTRPTLTARCSSTYFSTACAAAIDSEKTNTYIKTRIWLIDKEDSIMYQMFDANNGIIKL